MNKVYVIEDDLDFKTEIGLNDYDSNSIDENNSFDICLISKQPLTRTHIILQCNHKFNYMPLYNEICNQKMKNVYTVRTLHVNQIKCPYCRNVCDELLPYLPSEIDEKKTGVNFPSKYCMKSCIECDWINKKGAKCSKLAIYIYSNGYCKLHHTKIQNLKLEHKK